MIKSLKQIESFYQTRQKQIYLHLGIIFFVGLLIHGIPFTLPYALLITPFFLFIVSAFVLFSEISSGKMSFLIFVVAVYIVTMAVEMVGVATGAVFGEYVYGEALGMGLMGVPLVIGLNWVVVILGAAALCRRWIRNIPLVALLTGILVVIFDVILEPVAIHLGYWTWQGEVVPFQNYAVWGGLAFLASLFLGIMDIKLKDYLLSYIFIIETVYFLILLGYFGVMNGHIF